jgi:hypothetical protein
MTLPASGRETGEASQKASTPTPSRLRVAHRNSTLSGTGALGAVPDHASTTILQCRCQDPQTRCGMESATPSGAVWVPVCAGVDGQNPASRADWQQGRTAAGRGCLRLAG